jgi:hypothetical protein
MDRLPNLIREIAFALVHLDDQEALHKTIFASWPQALAGATGQQPESLGRAVQQFFVDALDRTIASSSTAAAVPTEVLYLDLRYRQMLPVAAVAAQLGYSREHLTRYYRRAGLQRLARILLIQNCAYATHCGECIWPACSCHSLERGFR